VLPAESVARRGEACYNHKNRWSGICMTDWKL
jgi:hypothetical protein